MLSAEKTNIETSSSSSARVKHLLGANNVYSRPGSSAEKQRAVDFIHKSSSHLVICMSQGMRFELRSMFLYLASVRHVPSYEKSSMELI
ncbi:hypothetical protein L3X38_011831 [Prunus dulcis]|uniref:Uncharacterized protein n=1 Tax=Prunus dulcis TaxID=3755 RepID=A0AAD4WI62_PRUDU|nr:hypothetical protein L3X38_011831 [Prunus dulcis]